MNTRPSIHCTYMLNAYNWAARSKAIRKKTGAVIVLDNQTLDNQTISDGYNGMPAGASDDCCEYTNGLGELVTKPEVLHAEANAILKLAAAGGRGTAGATLYCTLSPCQECAKLILQAKIKEVYYHEDYRIMNGVDFLRSYGVIVSKLDMGDLLDGYKF